LRFRAAMLALLKAAFKDFNEDECGVRAAALAYYTVFALPPLLILLITVAGMVWDPSDVQKALTGQFAGLIGRDGAEAVQGMIAAGEKRSRGATLAGIAGLLIGASGAFVQLQGALNRAWEVKPDPKQGGIKRFITKRLLSMGMVLGIGFLLAVSLALTAGVTALGGAVGSALPEGVLKAIEFAVSFAVITGLFGALFKVLPDAKIAWRDVWPGAIATSLLFVIGKFVIGLYLGRSSPGDAFGAASTLAVLLVWIYYASMILLFGAEFTQQWAKQRGRGIEPKEGAVRTDDDGHAVDGSDGEGGARRETKGRRGRKVVVKTRSRTAPVPAHDWNRDQANAKDDARSVPQTMSPRKAMILGTAIFAMRRWLSGR
jgi:membrane protein